MRELAHLSRDAANKIQKLVMNCMGLSEQAGDCLHRLTPNSRKTAELVKEIAAASHEQTFGAEQINHAIQQLDSVTQQNASTAEEVAATVETLTAQATQLREAMAFFTLKEIEPVEEQDDEANLLERLHELEQLIKERRAQNSGRSPSVPAKKSAPSATRAPDALFESAENASSDDERDQDFERY